MNCGARNRETRKPQRRESHRGTEGSHGCKTWMLVYADSIACNALQARPRLDRAATARLAKGLFPGEKLAPLEDGDLLDTCPPDDELYIGSFPGVAIVGAKEFG